MVCQYQKIWQKLICTDQVAKVNFIQNLLFQSPPRPFIRFASKLVCMIKMHSTKSFQIIDQQNTNKKDSHLQPSPLLSPPWFSSCLLTALHSQASPCCNCSRQWMNKTKHSKKGQRWNVSGESGYVGVLDVDLLPLLRLLLLLRSRLLERLLSRLLERLESWGERDLLWNTNNLNIRTDKGAA